MLPHAICAALIHVMPSELGALYMTYAKNTIHPQSNWATFRKYTRIPCWLSVAFDLLCCKPATLLCDALKFIAKFFTASTKGELLLHFPKCAVTDTERHFDFLNSIERNQEVTFTVNAGFMKGPFMIPQPKILRHDFQCHCADHRKPTYASFFTVADLDYETHASCNNNLYSGLTQRYLKKTPEYYQALWTEMIPHLEATICAFSTDYEPLVVPTLDDWLETRVTYGATKKQNIRKASLSCEANRFDYDSARIFTKVEMNVKLSDVAVKKKMKPRVIFEKTDVNIANVGPAMAGVKTLMNKLFDGSSNTKTLFACGLNRRALGQAYANCMAAFLHPVVYESDIVMCESSMKGPMAKLERRIYESWNVPTKALDVLFGKNRAIGRSRDGRLSYSLPVVKESGTTNTTVGNTVVYTYLIDATIRYLNSKRALEGLTPLNHRLVVGSDDAVLILSEKCDSVFDILLRLGLNTEHFCRDSAPRNARFYSGRFIRVSDDDTETNITMHMPLIAKAVAKSTTMRIRQGVTSLDWLRETLKGRRQEYKCTPFLREIYAWGARVADYEKTSHLPSNYNGPMKNKLLSDGGLMWDNDPHVLSTNEQTWLDLSEAYGLEVSALKNAERAFATYLAGGNFAKPFVNDVFRQMLVCDLE